MFWCLYWQSTQKNVQEIKRLGFFYGNNGVESHFTFVEIHFNISIVTVYYTVNAFDTKTVIFSPLLGGNRSPVFIKSRNTLHVLIMLITVRDEFGSKLTLISIYESGMSLHASTALSNRLQKREVNSSYFKFCNNFFLISTLKEICLSRQIFI